MWAKNTIIPPPHDEILTANCSEKERFSVNRQIKTGQTAKAPNYNKPPLIMSNCVTTPFIQFILILFC